MHHIFPTEDSGYIDELDCTWAAVSSAFRYGHRGLPSGTTLPKWISENFGEHNSTRKYIGEATLLKAVEQYREQNGGAFPTISVGNIPGLNVSWMNVDHALRDGHRGLPGGINLTKWLDSHYARVPDKSRLIRKEWLIAAVDAYREANKGAFPPLHSSVRVGNSHVTWVQVNNAMKAAKRPLGLWGL